MLLRVPSGGVHQEFTAHSIPQQRGAPNYTANTSISKGPTVRRNIPQLLYNYSIKALCIRTKWSRLWCCSCSLTATPGLCFYSFYCLHSAKHSAYRPISVLLQQSQLSICRAIRHMVRCRNAGTVLQVVCMETLENELLLLSKDHWRVKHDCVSQFLSGVVQCTGGAAGLHRQTSCSLISADCLISGRSVPWKSIKQSQTQCLAQLSLLASADTTHYIPLERSKPFVETIWEVKKSERMFAGEKEKICFCCQNWDQLVAEQIR